MSYSFDTDGWDLFNTPFSAAPVRTAPASPKQQAERSQQKPSEAMQRNRLLAQEQKTPPLSHSTTGGQPKSTAVQPPKPAPSVTAPVPDERPAPKAPAPVQADNTKQEPASPPKATVPASTQPAAPQKELVLNMSSGAAPVQNDTEKRKAHEESEAKRKAAWEAKQAAKKQAEEAALQQLNAMSDEDVITASTARIGTEVERLTRRNMKECVSEHIQELCRKDTAFARRTMHPRKNMIRCFRYITRMAKEYVKQEMENNDIKPDGGGYGCDVPDGLCYQWSEDYFNSADVLEDQEKEEKFVPKPYTGATAKTSSKTTKVATKAKKTEKQAKNSESKNNFQQMSLF